MRMDDFERLYAAHAAGLVRFLIYRTGDVELAEDVAADAFERAIRARRGLDRRRGTEKAWLYTIAVNLLNDHHRRQGAEARATERSVDRWDGMGTSPGLDEFGARDEVIRALETLGPEEREAVALRYAADFSVAEIAALNGEKAGTVEKRIFRALERLRRQLAPVGLAE